MTTETTTNDAIVNELDALNAELFALASVDDSKRKASRIVSVDRQAWYKRNTLDFGQNGQFTVVYRLFGKDNNSGFEHAYVIRRAFVDNMGKITYASSGLYMFAHNGTYESGKTEGRILSMNGKHLTSVDLTKRDLTLKIVAKAMHNAHLFGKSHRAMFAQSVMDALTKVIAK